MCWCGSVSGNSGVSVCVSLITITAIVFVTNTHINIIIITTTAAAAATTTT